jgi:hypothetical protein
MTALHLDHEQVVYETIDGETLLIHLMSGTYFSLRESGPEIWDLLVAEGSAARAAAVLAGRHPTQAAAVAAAVAGLADELLAHGLLVPGSGAAGPEPVAGRPAEPGPAFVAPVLEYYTDMQYFLMVDPIHEVDDAAGWPAPVGDGRPSEAV